MSFTTESLVFDRIRLSTDPNRLSDGQINAFLNLVNRSPTISENLAAMESAGKRFFFGPEDESTALLPEGDIRLNPLDYGGQSVASTIADFFPARWAGVIAHETAHLTSDVNTNAEATTGAAGAVGAKNEALAVATTFIGQKEINAPGGVNAPSVPVQLIDNPDAIAMINAMENRLAFLGASASSVEKIATATSAVLPIIAQATPSGSTNANLSYLEYYIGEWNRAHNVAALEPIVGRSRYAEKAARLSRIQNGTSAPHPRGCSTTNDEVTPRWKHCQIQNSSRTTRGICST